MEISNFRLEADEFNKIKRVLSSVLEKSRVEAVYLINRNGQGIANEGNLGLIDQQALATLAASKLAATYGLANILGEEEFHIEYLRGRRLSVLISPAGEHALLVFITQLANEKKLNVWNLKQAVLVVDAVLRKSAGRMKVADEV
jgi:predicted regulator of Ras-like GTPase activity (Roadblock/LC7/MglB family)